MTTEAGRERWEEVADLFDQLVELGEEEQRARLRELGARDAGLRRELESLLRAESDAPRWLDESAGERFEPLLEQGPDQGAPSAEVPSRIGSYRVLGEVGQGGMGIVYMAEHESGLLGQRVALKLVKEGVDNAEEVVARFARERLILARLEHPAIARMLDGGVTEDGRPFFAMELVEGEPITDYCERRQLAVEERLRLFRTVCEAVDYAHRAHVVHRDLKPANILVTREGRPKLLDFGIAKLLVEEAPEGMMQTAVGRRILTPAYAAPEQYEDEPVSTAIDVYALGVVLLELLTGWRPSTWRRATPRPPSQLLGSDRKAPGVACGLARDDLARRLAGDLDAVVLTALREAPDRRYPSARALADDIDRHLAGRPVTTRLDSRSDASTRPAAQ